MSDMERYQALQTEQFRRWEALCGHCGACCGAAEGDPCEHLAWNSTISHGPAMRAAVIRKI